MTGAEARQKQDAPVDAPGLSLAGAFLEANLEQLALRSQTHAGVVAARSSAQVSLLAGAQPTLHREGRALDGAPNETELRHVTQDDADALFVVFGLGLGQTVRALRSLTEAPIAVFEPDPGVLRSVLELGPTDLSHLEILCTTHDLSQTWPSLFAGRRRAVLVSTPGYLAAFPDAAAHLRETLAQLVQRSRVNDATHRLRAREWVSDLLANVELLGEHSGFLALARQYQGVPAFIVGAGPSLGKNGHLLLQAQKKGLVFAVNSSARALAHYGAEPHVLACMESIDVSHLLEGIEFIDRVVRAFSLTAHPRTLRTGRGPLLPIYEALPQIAGPLQTLTGHPGLPVSGSVSTLAFSLAERLGCSPIVFVGQDLAYTDGRAYAPGTAYQDSRVEVSADGRELHLNWCDTLKRTHNVDGRSMHEREPVAETQAWGGQGRVLTGIAFTAVRTWLESASVVLEREAPETRLVNATEGGARIAGFQESTLQSVLDELPDREFSARGLQEHAARRAPPLSREQLAAWAETQAKLVASARRQARRLRRFTEIAEAAARNGSPDVGHKLAGVERAERGLSQAVAKAALLDAWSWPSVDRLMDEHVPDLAEDAQASAARSLAFEIRLARSIDQSALELETELTRLNRRLRK